MDLPRKLTPEGQEWISSAPIKGLDSSLMRTWRIGQGVSLEERTRLAPFLHYRK